MKVLEQINLSNNNVAVVCDLFPDSVITSKIKTNIGFFSDKEFFVEKPKNCFSMAKTRNIVIMNIPNTKPITSIEFV